MYYGFIRGRFVWLCLRSGPFLLVPCSRFLSPRGPPPLRSTTRPVHSSHHSKIIGFSALAALPLRLQALAGGRWRRHAQAKLDQTPDGLGRRQPLAIRAVALDPVMQAFLKGRLDPYEQSLAGAGSGGFACHGARLYRDIAPWQAVINREYCTRLHMPALSKSSPSMYQVLV